MFGRMKARHYHRAHLAGSDATLMPLSWLGVLNYGLLRLLKGRKSSLHSVSSPALGHCLPLELMTGPPRMKTNQAYPKGTLTCQLE